MTTTMRNINRAPFTQEESITNILTYQTCQNNEEKHREQKTHRKHNHYYVYNNTKLLSPSTMSSLTNGNWSRKDVSYYNNHIDHGDSYNYHLNYHHLSNPNHLSLSQQYHVCNTLVQSSQQARSYSVSTHPKKSASLVLGLGAIAATAKAGQYAVRAYEQWKSTQPTQEEIDSQNSKNKDSNKEPKEDETSSSSFSSSSSTHKDQSSDDKSTNSSSNRTEGESIHRENIFTQFFNMKSNYYEGGFEDKMTKREAALILGVRESSTEKRIKEAHRKLLILNHPDTGGSTYLSGKVNEAKDLLLKGRGR